MLLGLAMIVAASTQAHAYETAAKPACDKIDTVFPAAFTAWGKPSAAIATKAAAPLNKRVTAKLPEAADKTHAGTFSLDVPADGIYMISASKPIWIDVIQKGVTLRVVKHGHDYAPCTSIRKTVEFPLKAGLATLNLSKSFTAAVDFLIVRKAP
ncbi:hypothetical protein [Govanella unica]|uniref:Uncharacterized protein n=1 Tax=Govanella unica TaxID=2975056 RepID=A0A9X3Z6W8_9PROT|nr:hypothetical protein [Govania unica]MDA5193443.1 hypothetical protein [Govania unica]